MFLPGPLLPRERVSLLLGNRIGVLLLKGKLNDGREIAVKKLSHSSNQGAREFMNEAKLLAHVQHRNVVNLLGYCVHGVEKLLVYEYVYNESLDKLLFSTFSVAFCYFPVLTCLFFSCFAHTLPIRFSLLAE